MKIKFSPWAFLSVLISSLLMSPLFGNFTPERLPVLVLVAIVLGGIWGVIFGTFISSK